MVFDRIENWRQYFSGPVWESAFTFLEKLSPDAEEGLTYLEGEKLFARVMSYATRMPDEAKLEAHREHIDIQMPLRNAEAIDWFPLAGLEARTPYDEKKDRVLFRRPAIAPAHVDLHPGTFAVLFPEDAHMPQLIVGDHVQEVKKVVVKVRLDYLKA